MKKAGTNNEITPSERITQYILELGDWRGEMLARLRKIHSTGPLCWRSC